MEAEEEEEKELREKVWQKVQREREEELRRAEVPAEQS